MSDPTLTLVSFGFKHGLPTEGNFMFDVRCLPNPFWNPELKFNSGLDEPVREYFKAQDSVTSMIAHIQDFLLHWRMLDTEKEMMVNIGCTGGQHRSVYVSSVLHEQLSAHYPDCVLIHRDQDRWS